MQCSPATKDFGDSSGSQASHVCRKHDFLCILPIVSIQGSSLKYWSELAQQKPDHSSSSLEDRAGSEVKLRNSPEFPKKGEAQLFTLYLIELTVE